MVKACRGRKVKSLWRADRRFPGHLNRRRSLSATPTVQVSMDGLSRCIPFPTLTLSAAARSIKRLSAVFRADVGCPEGASDPNVRGLGWSENGVDIYAFAQVTVSQSCGHQGDFRGFVVDMGREAIQQFYSERDAKQHFHSLLPRNMR